MMTTDHHLLLQVAEFISTLQNAAFQRRQTWLPVLSSQLVRLQQHQVTRGFI